mmetsp:Transcript_49070/g.115300  ORF Transcript_49070/g.115300 Transcript_49070/m.115300 type:complete len:272 (+) Transcript_49070:633-1448(+)
MLATGVVLALVDVDAACCAVAKEALVAFAGPRTNVVGACGLCVTVVAAGRALVDIDAVGVGAGESRGQAGAGVGSSLRVASVDTTPSVIDRTLVDVRARRAGTSVSSVAGARAGSWGVRACGSASTPAVGSGALVDVNAGATARCVPGHACASRCWVADVVRAISIVHATTVVGRTLVDVHTRRGRGPSCVGLAGGLLGSTVGQSVARGAGGPDEHRVDDSASGFGGTVGGLRVDAADGGVTAVGTDRVGASLGGTAASVVCGTFVNVVAR